MPKLDVSQEVLEVAVAKLEKNKRARRRELMLNVDKAERIKELNEFLDAGDEVVIKAMKRRPAKTHIRKNVIGYIEDEQGNVLRLLWVDGQEVWEYIEKEVMPSSE